MKLVGDNLHGISILFYWKNNKTYIDVSLVAYPMLSVNTLPSNLILS